MKQIEDSKTIDLLDAKRPVGRPPKIDALSGAERAKRFRDAPRGQAKKPQQVTENTFTVTDKEFRKLQRAEHSRTMALATAHSEIRILSAKLLEKDAEIAALRSRRKPAKK